ncbi:Biotin/lipoyl attachment domain-containing protein [Dioscorea alata]|uniref:Biotin/lipoyl attachment domain-containing protein n=1 Tax=Dioscorea alata TaxID=55571 RepID=A0ACB7VQM3_DIOAL|nr:Biotin/lipoyl attachment domain-containing protein [Dioscorea alata]
METAAVFRSLHGAIWTTQHTKCTIERPLVASLSNNAFRKEVFYKVPSVGHGLVASKVNRGVSFLPCVKASEAASALTSNDSLAKTAPGSSGEKIAPKSTFPNGFESLILGVCDETNVAELKIKVGDFEMHLRRDIGGPPAPPSALPVVSPTTVPPVPSKPMTESAPAAAPAAPQKASSSPFTNASPAKASKLAALEASGSNTFVVVSSPTVGSFRKGRTLKGKKQPPSCKQGDIIKEGQVIGFLDQFGSELPIKSDVAGEVLKVLFEDGEAVGYGDPLIAVLPSFHGIK